MLITKIKEAIANPYFAFLIKIDYICYNKQHTADNTGSDLVKSLKFKAIGGYLAWVEAKI